VSEIFSVKSYFSAIVGFMLTYICDTIRWHFIETRVDVRENEQCSCSHSFFRGTIVIF